jgi:hypothetical protein
VEREMMVFFRLASAIENEEFLPRFWFCLLNLKDRDALVWPKRINKTPILKPDQTIF